MKHAPLVLSIAALGLAAFALYKAPGPLLSGGKGMDAYDFSTPESAYRAGLEAQQTKDIGVMIELGRLVQEERNRTTKVEDSAVHDGGVVLFLSFEEDGKRVYKTQGMKSLHGKDIWVQDHISHYEVNGEDPELAARMEAWQDRTKQDAGK